jgi:predicted AlkP superfamily pyrophosphatase or phosphodiesterase
MGVLRSKRARLGAGLTCALALACTAQPSAPPLPIDVPLPEVGLVLVLAVDGLRPDRIDAELPGGLGRLVREGRSFERAALQHARTETCPGHASMLMGRHPGPAGVPGNQYVDREKMELVSCVSDLHPDAAVLGEGALSDPASGRSPRRLRADTLGDWMKASDPATRVFSVSAKDRAAIALGGIRPNVAYWLDRNGSGAFTTSRYYLDALPGWLSDWTAEGVLAGVPAAWSHSTAAPESGVRPDDYFAEAALFSRVSPHGIRKAGEPKQSVAQLLGSPYLDTRTLDFSRQLIVEERLGSGPATDLLAISLSGTDYIGHFYGPWSQESRDALQHLDADLSEFLAFLDERLGAGRMLVVLSADHGVLPLPEWALETGSAESECPTANGRISTQALEAGLTSQLDAVFGRNPGRSSRWFIRDHHELVFDPAAAAARRTTVERVSAQARAYLEALSSIERVWDMDEIRASREPVAALYRNSIFDEHPPDLVIQPVRGCLLTPYPSGTSHGSPYEYDRNVPLVFAGPGVTPGSSDEPAATIDIAPTLARLLGIPTPQGLDGRALDLTGD